MLLLLSSLFLLSTAKFCWLWDPTCVDKYIQVTAAFSFLRGIEEVDIAAGFCATFNGDTLQRVAYYNPVICVLHEGEPNEEDARSLYVNYSRHGKVVEAKTKNLSVEIPNFEGCLWQYRNFVFQVQLTFSRLIRISDQALLNRLLGYNTSEFGPYNQTLSCFNPLWDISIDLWGEICSVARYHIDFSKIPAKEVELWMSTLRTVTNLTQKDLSHCTGEAMRTQKRDFNIQYAVIGCISVLLIGVILLCIVGFRNLEKKDPAPESITASLHPDETSPLPSDKYDFYGDLT